MKNFCNNPRFMGGSAGVYLKIAARVLRSGGMNRWANVSVRKNVQAVKKRIVTNSPGIFVIFPEYTRLTPSLWEGINECYLVRSHQNQAEGQEFSGRYIRRQPAIPASYFLKKNALQDSFYVTLKFRMLVR
jgi:hypothetical protein